MTDFRFPLIAQDQIKKINTRYKAEGMKTYRDLLSLIWEGQL